MKRFSRRAMLLAAGAAAGAAAMRGLGTETIGSGQPFPQPLPTGPGDVLNDASLLSPTRIARHLTLVEDRRDSVIDAIRAELVDSKSQFRPVIASAARHSMGAQSLSELGTVITLDKGWLEPDTKAGVCRVSAGMRWSEVISRLDTIGFSPKVMQSNNDFGVASTFSVNAHGWPVPWSAFGSTVRSIVLITAEGEVVTCSRQSNAEIFNMAMGGYGLVGIIVELEMEIVPNLNLIPVFERMPAEEIGMRMVKLLSQDATVEMAYGRLDVTIGSFFEDGLLVSYRPTADQNEIPPAAGSGLLSEVAAKVFRAQVGSDRVKSLRWSLETEISPALVSGISTRNSLMNEPVVTLNDNDPSRTDILHEYFVSPSRFAEFVQICREVIPSSYQELLNITLRFVDTDRDSVLAYATEPRIAAVMLFSQEMSMRAEDDMARMTQNLIDRVLEIGGSYYLPYRPHATQAQFRKAYGRSEEFANLKRSLDPQLRFQNGLWKNYIAQI